MKILETIQIKDGAVQQIDLHEARLNDARQKLFGDIAPIQLSDYLLIPAEFQQGIVRCRVIYEQEIEEVGFVPYVFKQIKTLKVVEAKPIDYAIKWLDRTDFGELLANNTAFDELIIGQNGYVSDATIANLAFWDGTHWFTPDTPLLKGTRRRALLESGKITQRAIRLEEIRSYKKVCLINTFRDLLIENAIDISQVF
ncbi:aminotransferase class IV [Flectobacillus major]|uniref:aminotransferase class IV n=1 Tax=Flectobacillus major TaxID=103 RepID=UPI00040CFBF6|nr:aminotransferase class IV [Flectobacillus major]